MHYLILLLSLLVPTAHAYHLKVDSKRLIEIDGVIRNLDSEAKKLDKLSESREPVFIKINSPGGSVLAGLFFIQAMERAQYRGVQLVCYVENRAASMAMHILGACSKRFAYRTSTLKWHPASISLMGRVTEERAEQIQKQLRLLTGYLDEKLRQSLQLSKETYQEYYKGDYHILAYDLRSTISPRFLVIIEDVK